MPASSTAEWVALYRAAEAMLPAERAIYRDPDAHLFVGDRRLRRLLARRWRARATLAVLDAFTPGLAGQAFVRYRYFDERLAAMLDDGLEQVVLLGAGYDATALRLARGGDEATVYEVDEPDTQARKRELVEASAPGALRRTVFVECDFTRDSVAERLSAAGHSADRPTLFSWLGVSWYLDAATVDAFLADLAAAAAPGSRIVFDYVHASALAGGPKPPGVRLATRVVSRQGEPWTFGRDPDEAEAWLAGLGWTTLHNVRASDLRDHYQGAQSGRLRPAADWVSVVDAGRTADAR